MKRDTAKETRIAKALYALPQDDQVYLCLRLMDIAPLTWFANEGWLTPILHKHAELLTHIEQGKP